MLGHLKTILILVLGFVMFNKTVDYRNVLGITVAMAGVIWYTEVRRSESSMAQVAAREVRLLTTDDEKAAMIKV